MSGFRRSTGYLAALLVLATTGLWAQGEAVNARLAGTVVDAKDAAVPGAGVSLSSAQTGFTRQFTTTGDGGYTFTLIPPGQYQLKVEKEGFSTYVQSNILLAVGQSSTLNPRLEVGPISQIVEVAADAPLLNAGNANIGTEILSKQVVELPLNIRNVFNLVLLNSSVNNSTQYQGLT